MKTRWIELTEAQAEVFESWQELLHEPDPSKAALDQANLEMMRTFGESPIVEVDEDEEARQKKLSEVTVDELCELLGLEVDINREKRAVIKAEFCAAREFLAKVVDVDAHNCRAEEIKNLKEFNEGFARAVRRHFVEYMGEPFVLFSAFRGEGK